MLESLGYENNWFLTLTYDDAHIPQDGLLHRDDLQKFFKRLRKFTSFRYFGCGEYGSHTKRPHYHLILFGADLDFKPDGLYGTSDIVAKCWPFGFHYLGDVTYSSCNYVARYTTKKLLEKDDKPGEFLCCSTKPGLGYRYLRNNLEKILKYDAVFGDFGSSKSAMLPRYFDKVAQLLDEPEFLKLKKTRLDKGNQVMLHELLNAAVDEQEKLLELKDGISIREFVAHKRGLRL